MRESVLCGETGSQKLKSIFGGGLFRRGQYNAIGMTAQRRGLGRAEQHSKPVARCSVAGVSVRVYSARAARQ